MKCLRIHHPRITLSDLLRLIINPENEFFGHLEGGLELRIGTSQGPYMNRTKQHTKRVHTTMTRAVFDFCLRAFQCRPCLKGVK
jgi:hypothetical protein